MMPSAWGWVLIVTGLALIGGGLWLLRYGRKWRNRQDLHIAGNRAAPKRRKMSEPTRLVCSVLLLFAGYHAFIWAFPPERMPLQLSRQWWWAWLLVGLAMIPLSLALDRLDDARLSEDPRDSGD